ncbi:MAG: hypothetical protein M3259_05405, partial [Actinomycetota bacterium]|nr:hypothetical protein [Actinomycetota bacterium]
MRHRDALRFPEFSGAPGGGEYHGSAAVEALSLFTSRAFVDAFTEGFFPEESLGARQELERP